MFIMPALFVSVPVRYRRRSGQKKIKNVAGKFLGIDKKADARPKA